MRLRPGSSPWGDPEESRPRDLGLVGGQLWSDVTTGWRDFDVLQLVILRHVCETADLIDRLEELLGAEELIAADGPRAQVIDELRRQRAALVEMLESLELPEDGPSNA